MVQKITKSSRNFVLVVTWKMFRMNNEYSSRKKKLLKVWIYFLELTVVNLPSTWKCKELKLWQ